jgi:hypothetical protein
MHRQVREDASISAAVLRRSRSTSRTAVGCGMLISGTGSGGLSSRVRRGSVGCRRNSRLRTAGLSLDGLPGASATPPCRVDQPTTLHSCYRRSLARVARRCSPYRRGGRCGGSRRSAPLSARAMAPGEPASPSRQGLAGAATRALDRPDRPRCPTCYLPNQASTPAWSQGWYQYSEILPSRKCTTKTSLVEKVWPLRRMVACCRTIPCSSSAR